MLNDADRAHLAIRVARKKRITAVTVDRSHLVHLLPRDPLPVRVPISPDEWATRPCSPEMLAGEARLARLRAYDLTLPITRLDAVRFFREKETTRAWWQRKCREVMAHLTDTLAAVVEFVTFQLERG